MKIVLLSWFIWLVLRSANKFVVQCWASDRRNVIRVVNEEYPAWIYIILVLNILALIASIVITFIFIATM